LETNSFDLLSVDKIKKHENLLQLIRLLFDKIVLYVDWEKEELVNYLENPFIVRLIKENRLHSRTKEFQDITKQPRIYFSKNYHRCTFFMMSSNENIRNNHTSWSGNYFVTVEGDFGVLMRQELRLFEYGKAAKLSNFAPMLRPNSSLVIADPYLFQYGALKVLEEFILSACNMRYSGVYYVTLLGKSRYNDSRSIQVESVRKEIRRIEDCLQGRFDGGIIVECIFCNQIEFHDRWFITNNQLVISGNSLDLIHRDKSKKETTWFGIKAFSDAGRDGRTDKYGFELINGKLRKVKEWIEESGFHSNNPIFSGLV
jgi:hypothetical protein